MNATNLKVLCDFADEALEGELADEELRRLLVPTDLAEGDGTRPEAVRLLHATGRGLCGGKQTLRTERKGKESIGRTAAVLRA